MEFYDVINERESIRNYDFDKTIPKEILERVLDAARIAPSAMNRQPWQILVVQSNEMLEKVKSCYSRNWLADSRYILCIKGNIKNSWIREEDGYNSLQTDLTIAMTHIILAAKNEGLGTCWIAAFDSQKLRSALELSDDEFVYAMTPIGYQKDDFIKKNSTPRKSLEEIVTYI